MIIREGKIRDTCGYNNRTGFVGDKHWVEETNTKLLNYSSESLKNKVLFPPPSQFFIAKTSFLEIFNNSSTNLFLVSQVVISRGFVWHTGSAAAAAVVVVVRAEGDRPGALPNGKKKSRNK